MIKLNYDRHRRTIAAKTFRRRRSFEQDLDIDLQHKQCSVTHNLVHSSGLAYQAQIAFETLLVDKGLVHPFLRLNFPNAAYNEPCQEDARR